MDSPFGWFEQIIQTLLGLSPEWPGVHLRENIPHPLLSGLEMPQDIHGREQESGWRYLEPPTGHPGIRVPPHPLPPPPIESEDDVASLTPSVTPEVRKVPGDSSGCTDPKIVD